MVLYKRVWVFKDEKFSKTGWNVKTKKVKIDFEPWSRVLLYMHLVREGDPWDRVCGVFVNGVEVLRGITPHEAWRTHEIYFVEDITEYAKLLSGEVEVGAYVTTYVGAWRVSVWIDFALPLKGFEVCYPIVHNVFSREHVEDASWHEKEVKIRNLGWLRIFASGHSSAEGKFLGKNMVIDLELVKGSEKESITVIYHHEPYIFGRLVPSYYIIPQKLKEVDKIRFRIREAVKYIKTTITAFELPFRITPPPSPTPTVTPTPSITPTPPIKYLAVKKSKIEIKTKSI